ncbi:hypothetical protein QC762_305860 [Podospora pseudocomata]|uniref:Biogenesis of lysosome-related organelles complex 1 subunit 1 n=1 Tax=Podospora pseudocomata TaxID=2093779 RepID=A0ABR0GJ88_9PEZI|nr:hypothetical protein QC762_305860 [Podospora pseudocomata]
MSTSKPSPPTRMLFRGSSSTLSAPEVSSVAVTAITFQPQDGTSSPASRSRTESVTSTPSSSFLSKGKSPLSLLSGPSTSGPSTSTTVIGSNHTSPPLSLPQPPVFPSSSQPQSQPHLPPPPSHHHPPPSVNNSSLQHPSRSSSHPFPVTAPPDPKAIDQARTALLATLSNYFDREITPRAQFLHQNNAAIEKQQSDLIKATQSLKKENDKLAKMADTYGKKVKEVGNVQNWAEMLEREFLILEDTLRRAKEGNTSDEEEEGSWTGSESCWSGSEDEGEGDWDRGEGEGARPEEVPLPEPEPGEGGL